MAKKPMKKSDKKMPEFMMKMMEKMKMLRCRWNR